MSYTISLDAIDLKYLPISNYVRENKVKLFDVRSAKRQDYIEFEIFASKKDDETNNGTIPPHCTTVCQICDVSIPTCYIIEHNQSDKHKMYKSIMDNALERAKKYLNEDNSVSDTKKLPYSYFCDICCLALLNSEKDTHEKSQKHLEQIKKLQQLNDFLSLYSLMAVEDNKKLLMTADSDGIPSNLVTEDMQGRSDEVSKVVKSTESEVKLETQSTVEPAAVKRRVRLRGRRKKLQIEAKSEVSESDEKQVEPKVKAEVILKVEKLKTNEDSRHFVIPEAILCKDIVEITFTDGTVINVFEHNYNGFISVTDDITICLLCNEFVSNTLAHKESPKHLKKIEVPVDANCIRKMENNFYHCILCYEVFSDVKDHVDSNKLHQANKIDANSLSTMLHHENFVTVSEVNNNFPDYYHFEIKKQFLNCKVCNLTLINSVEFARKHVGSISHVAMYKELLKSNRLSQVDENYFECNFCNKAVLKRTELFHITDKLHKIFFNHDDICRTTDQVFKWKNVATDVIKEIITILTTEIERPAEPDFELSNFDWPKLSKEDVSAQPNSKLSADELPNGIRSTFVFSVVHCTICSVNLPNTLLNVEQHIRSAKHKDKHLALQ